MLKESIEREILQSFALVMAKGETFDTVLAARSAIVRDFVRRTCCLSPKVLVEAAEIASRYAVLAVDDALV